jgi:hypothetical protein
MSRSVQCDRLFVATKDLQQIYGENNEVYKMSKKAAFGNYTLVTFH